MKILLSLLILIITLPVVGQRTIVIPKNADGAWYFPSGNHGILPGDTVLISGNVGYALFEKVIGTAARPVIFLVKDNAHIGINDKGVLGGYGLLIQNSAHFKVIGNGKLKIGGTSSAKYLAQGMGLHNSTDYEVAGCEIQFVQVGMYSNGVGYHMLNISIHDNVIHDTDNPTEGGRSEGIYFGNTGINTTKSFSFRNIKIYRNRFYKLSGDGIQLALALNYEVYENTIEDYGRARNDQQQNEGIIIGSGSYGRVYNNTVRNGSGSPFQCFGAGANYFENNTAFNTCQMLNEDAFYIGNRSPDSATVVYIRNNTVDKTSRDFVRKESNTTVYQSGNKFGSVVPPPPPPAPTRVDSVTKASYDSAMRRITELSAALSAANNAYGILEKQLNNLEGEYKDLDARLTEIKNLVNKQ